MSRPLIDLVEDLDQIDPFYVANKDEEYMYCWLNKKPENVQKMKDIFGYEVIGSKHTEGALVPPNPAGERVHGDVVLARISRERWEKIQAMKKRRAESQITAANDNWRQQAEKSGLFSFDQTRHETAEFTSKSK